MRRSFLVQTRQSD